MLRTLVAAALIVGLLAPLLARGGNWDQWRGPGQNGFVPDGGYPTQWGEEENIAWKAAVPGWGTSTPAIWGDRIVVSTEIEERNALLGLDRGGRELWRVTFGPSAGNRNRKASSANPSPATDGTLVYGYYKSGDLACVDLDGQVVWQTNLQQQFGPDRLLWDLGTSPVLTGDLVVVAVMHAGPSYLAAFEKETGNVAWKQDRPTGAPGESRDSYTTPLVLDDDGQEVLVVLGADTVTAHLASSGEELWRVEGLNPDRRANFRSIASPVAVDGLVIAPYARGNTLTAIRLGGRGDVSRSHVAWTRSGPFPDVPSPAVHEGRVYTCGDRGEITCLDAASGREIWTHRLPRGEYPFSSSPIIADGHLYATAENGTTYVLRLGDPPRLVATNVLRENTYATPAFADGQIFLRTSEWLFCIGRK